MQTKNLFYKRKNHLIGKKIQGEFIIIDPQSENVYVLNETGEAIFRFLHTKRSMDDIVQKVTSEFQIHKEKVSKDIRDFLKMGLEYNIL